MGFCRKLAVQSLCGVASWSSSDELELIRKIADVVLLLLLPPPPLSKNIEPTLNLKLAKIKQSPEARDHLSGWKEKQNKTKQKTKQNRKASLSEVSCGSEWFWFIV